MTLNTQEMLVLQALETGLEMATGELDAAKYVYRKFPNHANLRQMQRNVIEIEAAIDIVKSWSEQKSTLT